MPTYKLEELSFPRVNSLSRERTLFALAVSPLEEHGPHLPVGVDAMTARYFVDELTRLFLEHHPEWNVVEMPPLTIGSDVFNAPGSLRVRPRAVRAVVIDQLSSLARHGFRYFLISNAHGGPRHVVALEEAVGIVSRRHGVRAVSLSGQLIWKFLLGAYWPQIVEHPSLTAEEEEALTEDAHAGMWETSMMLKLKAELVDPSHKQLKPFTAGLIGRLRPNYPLRHGAKGGYIGHPALASTELADASSSFLIQEAYAMMEQQLFSAERPPHSMFFRIPVFRIDFLPAVALAAVSAALLYWLPKVTGGRRR
jgi:creatinine amidohydrolase